MVYFNNDSGSMVPVTFQVDMTAAVLSRSFIPDSYYVEARGSFQSPTAWTGGFTLTNDPAASNKNLYSGTYLIAQAAGSRIDYKFYALGTLTWESPASTGGGNRSFTLAATAQTLTPVYFNDVSPSDLLGEDTLVTFQVNMTNAQAIAWNLNPSFVFNPTTDSVYLNGAFIPWWNWSIDFPNADWKLTNAPGVQVYSIAVPFLKGSPVGISYKYGINGGDNKPHGTRITTGTFGRSERI